MHVAYFNKCSAVKSNKYKIIQIKCILVTFTGHI